MRVSSQWTERSSLQDSLTLMGSLALSHAQDGGTQGEAIAHLIREGNYLGLCEYTLDYEVGTTWQLQNCRQALGFYSKFEPLPLGIDKKAVALKKWYLAEAMCKQTNDVFHSYASGEFNLLPDVDAVLHSARRKIARVLGDVPSYSSLRFRFGPGSTTHLKKMEATLAAKLEETPKCSSNLLPYAGYILAELPEYAKFHGLNPCEVKRKMGQGIPTANSRVGFVSKNARTHRSIATEPVLNLMVQLALGEWIEKRLLSVGQDIKDQNRQHVLAHLASIEGAYATLDLSMASDTIATAVVYELLPIGWAHALDLCRSRAAEVDGKLIQLEKFSSMGNGFTFPLQTLIFWALASSCSENGFASVYGDDIIIPTEAVSLFSRVLTACGFVLNATKSYSSGPFRETCGVDYLRGTNIRPLYIEKCIAPSDLFRLSNFYYLRGDLERCAAVRQYIHPSLRIHGPPGYGDGHLIDDSWKRKLHPKAGTHGYGGVTFDTFVLDTRKCIKYGRRGDRLLPTYSIYRRGAEEEIPLDHRKVGRLYGLIGRERSIKISGTTPIPDRVSPVDGEARKVLPIPSDDDELAYKRVSIYTFSR